MGRLSLYVFAALILGLGIGSATGLTGKDEYLLGLRIPLEMIQGDHWWVPFIDGAPRLKKPPFIYWLGRASFETFGIGLVSARGITVAFALLLLGCTHWLGKRCAPALAQPRRIALIAAAVLLGMSGLASESRRLMLDVPVAALSVAAFCLYLHWIDRRRTRTLLAAALCLSAALLTKGPIALVGCGSGLLALWLTDPAARWLPLRHWFVHALTVALALALPVAWYLYVKRHYGAELAQAAHDELEARQVMDISADAAIGILTLALPWSLVAANALWVGRRDPRVRFLGLWLLFSLLPFFFIRAFERYLIASLVPLALLAALALDSGLVPRWTRRIGSLLPALLALALGLLLWRWQLDGWFLLALALYWFLRVWWRDEVQPLRLALSAALLWCVGWGLAFPNLGVNAVPDRVVALARQQPVLLFAGPQPALLPILSSRPQHQTSQLTANDVSPGTVISLRDEDRAALDKQLSALAVRTRPVDSYRALTSAGSGIRFAREGATREDWRRAWEERTSTPLMSGVQLLEVLP
ncbi:MAG TPA: phospholipid carrier-dependent glycosyltransferase [Rhodocyclaceae bacterium]